ncbi:hypothetical protein PLICRDRAFT_36153 [Plicaturopsis crispa FD-325 SS-3]|nr:hypothetical protein PLICRDRAFT_36153 [Plicaturopsis crispa FD-325 SS-3]
MGAKSGKKSSLKATLQSQQSRLLKKQKAAQKALAVEQKQKEKIKGSTQTKSKGKEKAGPPQITIPFRPTDRILLIGEGNFSFARALVSELADLPASNVTATAYDSQEECFAKYADAEEIVEELKGKGVEVLFGVDASKLEKVGALKRRKWDRIVWNFPHAGKGITDQDRNILSNQVLILGFLRSAAKHLTLGPEPSVIPRKRKRKADDDEEEELPDAEVDQNGFLDGSGEPIKARGTVLITLRNVSPYTLWNIPRLAKNPPPPTCSGTPPNPPFILLRSFVFHRSAWKGYEHRTTKGERGRTGEGGEDRTWEFCLKDIDVAVD